MLICETLTRPGGRVLPGGASLPYGSIEVLEKKFAEFFGNSNLSWHGCRPRYSGRRLRRCDKPGTPEKLLPKPRHPAQKQYGLQIAEGVVKFLESYQYLDRF